MSKFDTEDRGALGFFLSEDGELRLRKLHQHIEFLARLSEPRIGEKEEGPAIDTPSLSNYMELLAEQVQQILDEVSEPSGIHRPEDAAAAKEGASDTDDGAEAISASALRPGASDDDDYAFGMTLDQLDEMNRLLDQLTAQGDLLMASSGGDLAEGTLIVTGAAIFSDADTAHTIIRQVNSQRLEDAPAPRMRVRETPPPYIVHMDEANTRQHDHRVDLH